MTLPITTIKSNIVNPTQVEGGIEKVVVSDDDVEHLLGDSLKELKKLNFQMSLMTDTEVTNEDI